MASIPVIIASATTAATCVVTAWYQYATVRRSPRLQRTIFEALDLIERTKDFPGFEDMHRQLVDVIRIRSAVLAADQRRSLGLPHRLSTGRKRALAHAGIVPAVVLPVTAAGYIVWVPNGLVLAGVLVLATLPSLLVIYLWWRWYVRRRDALYEALAIQRRLANNQPAGRAPTPRIDGVGGESSHEHSETSH